MSMWGRFSGLSENLTASLGKYAEKASTYTKDLKEYTKDLVLDAGGEGEYPEGTPVPGEPKSSRVVELEDIVDKQKKDLVEYATKVTTLEERLTDAELQLINSSRDFRKQLQEKQVALDEMTAKCEQLSQEYSFGHNTPRGPATPKQGGQLDESGDFVAVSLAPPATNGPGVRTSHEVDDLEETVEGLRSEVARLNSTLDEQKRRADDARQQAVSGLEARHSAERKRMEEEVEGLKRQKAELVTQVLELQMADNSETLRQELAALRQQLVDSETRAASGRDEGQAAHTRIASELQSALSREQQLRQELNDAARERARSDNVQREFLARINALERQLGGPQRAEEVGDADVIPKLELAVRQLLDERELLREGAKQVTALEEQNGKLLARLDEMGRAMSEMQEKCDTLSMSAADAAEATKMAEARAVAAQEAQKRLARDMEAREREATEGQGDADAALESARAELRAVREEREQLLTTVQEARAAVHVERERWEAKMEEAQAAVQGERQRWEAKMEEMTMKTEASQSNSELLANEVASLQQQLREAAKSQSSTQGDREGLAAEVAKLQHQLREANETMAIRRDDFATQLAAAADQLDAEMARHRVSEAEWARERDTLKLRSSAVEGGASEERARMERALGEMQERQAGEVARIQQECESLRQRAEDASVAAREAEARAHSLERERDEAVGSASAGSKELVAKLQALESQRSAWLEEKRALEESYRAADRSRQSQEDKIEGALQQVMALRKEKQAVETQRAALAAELEEARKMADKELASVKTAAEQRISGMQGDLEQLKERLLSDHERLKKSEDARGSIDADKQSLQAQVQRLANQVATLEMDAREKKLAHESALAELRGPLEKTQTHVERLKKQMMEQEERYTQEILESQAVIEKLEKQLEQFSASERSSSEAQAARANQLATEAERMRIEVREREADCERLKLENANLVAVLEQFQERQQGAALDRVATLEGQLAAADRAKHALEARMQEAKAVADKVPALEQALVAQRAESSRTGTMLRAAQDEIGQLRAVLEKTAATKGRDEDFVDRSIVANLFAAYFDRAGTKKDEVLRVIASMLKFDEKQKARVGLGGGGGWFSSWFGGRPSEVDGKTLSDMWVEFLLLHSEQQAGAQQRDPVVLQEAGVAGDASDGDTPKAALGGMSAIMTGVGRVAPSEVPLPPPFDPGARAPTWTPRHPGGTPAGTPRSALAQPRDLGAPVAPARHVTFEEPE